MTNNNQKISFIIPAYNCADTIAESIDSIFNGNFEDGDEVIIVNDASTDKTPHIVNSLQEKHPAIKTISHTINKGSAAAARNTAIDKSKNDLIFCLDSDNILVPKSVHALKEVMLSENADVASFGELYFFRKNTDEISQKWIFNKQYTLFDVINEPKNPGSSGNYLYTKKSWLRAKRYNESVGGAYDSWAFGVAQLATGSKMITMEKSFYFHRSGHDSAFVRDAKKQNTSLLALQVLLPYLHLLEEEDIDYIMSPENRFSWFENVYHHPIRIKKEAGGEIKKTAVLKENVKMSLFNRIKRKIKKYYFLLNR